MPHDNGHGRAAYERGAQFTLIPSEHRPRQSGLFPSEDPLVGRHVRLDRAIDRREFCHANIAEIGSGHGPHGHELRCAACGAHRGWLPKEAATFLCEAIRNFGMPQMAPIFRDSAPSPTVPEYPHDRCAHCGRGGKLEFATFTGAPEGGVPIHRHCVQAWFEACDREEWR